MAVLTRWSSSMETVLIQVILCSSLRRVCAGKLFRTAGPRWLRSCALRRFAGRYRLFGLRGCESDANVLVNRLALVVVFGMRLAVGTSDGLRRFIGFEAQIAGLVFVGFGVVAETVVAKHQVVVCLQIFRVDGKSLLEFFDGIRVALFEKAAAAKLVAHDAVARELREHGAQVSHRAVVVAVLFEGAGVEEISAR